MVVPIQAQGLRFTYEGLPEPALDGVDLQLDEGEFVAVLGPNGAGKSTLLKLLAGVLSSDSGSVLLEEQALGKWSARERAKRLALVPQSLHSLPEVTVESFVGYGRYAYRRLFGGRSSSDELAIRDAMGRADLAQFAQRPLAELSGGQRQRALVARALAQEARVLLVDEPTNALDPEHQLRVFDLLAELCERGHSVVVVTHELNLASQFVHRGLLLAGGKPIAAGPIESVLCPEVLEPVYGKDLVFGEQWAHRAQATRPFVLPWKAGGQSES